MSTRSKDTYATEQLVRVIRAVEEYEGPKPQGMRTAAWIRGILYSYKKKIETLQKKLEENG